MRILVTLLISSCILTSYADTIELWNGKVAQDATIIGVQEGVLKFKRYGRIKKVKLANIKNIIKEDDLYKIFRFADHQTKRYKGKLLTINVSDPRERVYLPIIRVFCYIKNNIGAYEVHAFQNVRHSDPTRVFKLPIVDTSTYDRQHYFVSRIGLAYRVEIWQDGELRCMREEVAEGEEAPEDWYKTLRIKSTKTFKKLSEAEIPGIQQSGNSEAGGLSAKCSIRTVSLKPTGHKKNTDSVTVYYSLLKVGKDRVEIPEINFHYVTEDKDGNRDISSLKVDGKSGRETALLSGRANRTVTTALPSGVRASRLAVSKGKSLKRVIFWVVEAKYGDAVAAFKEHNNPTVKKSLPKNWWE